MAQKWRSLNSKDIRVKEPIITKQLIVLGIVSKETATEKEALLFISLEKIQPPEDDVDLPSYRQDPGMRIQCDLINWD